MNPRPLPANFGRIFVPVISLFYGLLLACPVGVAKGAESGGAVFEKARFVLEKHCFKCHSHESGKSKGGLLVDSLAAMVEGGSSGPSVVPGDPAKSLLMRAVRHEDPDLEMPPKEDKLPDDDIAVLADWIKAGAPWPEEMLAGEASGEAAGVKRRKPGVITEEDRKWWAFVPVVAVEPPAVKADPAFLVNEIDHFILARLEQEGLQPAPEAGRLALIRRVTFDLTGLPPTPQDIDAFLADTDPQAYERVVDRLLASPAYGERMARHWLDLVRYADGDGYRADDYRPHAWRYRDYVIRSFNNDKPYDRFVSEQLAGDEMFPGDPDALIATGYFRHGIYEWNQRDVRTQWDVMLDDITDTTGDVFLGLGLQCARCHDHKFDPLLQKDYYRLRAFFAAIQPGDKVAAVEADLRAYEAKLKVWENQTADLRGKIAALEKPYLDKAEKEAVGRFPDDIQEMIRKPVTEREPLEEQLATLAWRQVLYDWERVDRSFKGQDKETIIALKKELASLEKEKPAPLPVAFAASDVGPVAPPVFIPKKKDLGEIVPGILTILNPDPIEVTPLPESTGRRSALVRWMIDPENPLTARVMVNRVWQQHFGRGLAANASDFGMLGEQPSHPALLDWLANKFVKEDWSLKKLHRLVVTSATYRQSSYHNEPEKGLLVDPENRLLWRWQPRRLEAEQIRDAMLAVSGEMQNAAGGPGVTPDVPRRTIFTRFMRNTRDPLADVFDAPLWFTSTASRNTTTTPVQSLLLANSASMHGRARAFAVRLEKQAPGDPSAQVALAYQLAFGRKAESPEIQAALDFIKTQAAQADTKRLSSDQAAFLPDKLPYRDGQAAVIAPDGEQQMFSVSDSQSMFPEGDFTIEAFVVPRSVAETGALRTIVSKWDGNNNGAGWTMGITGMQSRRKPFTIALQLVGLRRDGSRGEFPVFSDFGLQLNKPYFVAASVTMATKEKPGRVNFALKDLSNDDEPLLTSVVEHEITGGLGNAVPVVIGSRFGDNPQTFHGIIDDIRLSCGALPTEKLLYTMESVAENTLGYWKFEAKPDVFADVSDHGRSLERPSFVKKPELTPEQAALTDFCQALFNASEFLYTE